MLSSSADKCPQTIFIMKDNKIIQLATPVFFWGGLWYLISLTLGNTILLPRPDQVLARLADLVPDPNFWQTVANSFVRMAIGLVLGVMTGLSLGITAFVSKLSRMIVQPMMTAIKATPIASVTILLLVWMRSANLSILLVALVVSPLIYEAVISGLAASDPSMIEVFQVFRTPRVNQWRLLYFPQIKAYLEPALSYALGFAWKAGVSGEILAQPTQTIGEEMYYAKLYLDMPSLFAYTLVVVLISLITERGLKICLDKK